MFTSVRVSASAIWRRMRPGLAPARVYSARNFSHARAASRRDRKRIRVNASTGTESLLPKAERSKLHHGAGALGLTASAARREDARPKGPVGEQQGQCDGLYLSRLVVEGHGGDLANASEGEDKGATVRVRLPLAGSV